MRRGGAADGEGGAILLARAARLWGVSRGTAYAWHKTGRIRCFREGAFGLEASLDDVRAEKVLPESVILGEKVTRKLLDEAIARRLVIPDGWRFSLADRDQLREFAATAATREIRAAPERHQSGTRLITVFDWTVDEERIWVASGADPTALPDGFWATPRPPRYVAPAGVFLYRPGHRLPEGGPRGRFVWRSTGYERRGNDVVWCHADERYARILDGEPMPAAWLESNHRRRVGKEQWFRLWVRRQSRLRTD